MSRRRQDEDHDVFSLFGTEPAVDPRLKDALQALANAVWELPLRSRDFGVEPDLAALSWAVQDVLEAAGHPEALVAADRWVEYETRGRDKAARNAAWLRCDALFRMDVEAAKVGGWENLAAQRPEVSDPSRPLLPLQADKPGFPPTD